MEIRNEQRAHRADSAQLLQRFLRIEQDFKRIQKGHQESLEREREFERRISALEELIKQQAPAAAPSSFGLDDLALRYVLEYTADQQRQREELGKLALAPPPGQGLARVAEDLGVDPGRLSMQGKGKVMVMDMTTAKAAQAWLQGGGGEWVLSVAVMYAAAADAWEEGAAQAVPGGAEAGGAGAARLRVQGQVQPAPLLGTCEGGLRAGGPLHSVPCLEAPAARHFAGF